MHSRAEFPAATREQWLKLVDGVLKGAPFDKRLVANTYDGLPIQPLYPRDADARPVAARAPGAAWSVMQRVDHPDPAAANEQALHDLENGATGLTLVLAGSLNANGYGLDGFAGDARARARRRLSRRRRRDRLQRRRADARRREEFRRAGEAPRHRARNGRDAREPQSARPPRGDRREARPWTELAPYFAALVQELAAHGFRGPFAVADGRVIHNAGGSEAQELAFALASAVTYLRALEAGGIALDAARRMIYFRLAADADQFLTIAKFRAIRKLWARVEQACGLAPAPAFVAAETAWRMMTRRDPDVNILRTTVAVVAAGLGGADAITVLPFTAALGLPDRFARRIARNTQLVLLEESQPREGRRPGGGRGRHRGPDRAALRRGVDAIPGDRDGGRRRRGAVAGPDPEQGRGDARRAREEHRAPARRAHRHQRVSGYSRGGGACAGCGAACRRAANALRSRLPRIRLAEPFEALRDASDRMLAATARGRKSSSPISASSSDFTARTLFARNLFEAGGIEAVSNDGFASRDEMIAAFKASGATLVCLCSSDKVYEAEAVDAAKALRRQARRTSIWRAVRASSKPR